MSTSKYYTAVQQAQAAAGALWSGPLPPFEFGSLAPEGRIARFRSRLTQPLLSALYAVSRRFFPVFELAGLTHLTRDAQVREVLGRPEDFRTPFGPEMAELADGATFLLGIDGPEHDRLHAIMRQVLDPADGALIAELSQKFAAGLLDNSAGRIDAVEDLLKRVPAEICLRYFGLACDDVDQFGDWTMALSAFLFGDPYADPKTRALAVNAARRLRFVIDDAIARAQRDQQAGLLGSERAETLVERLVQVQAREPVSDAEIRAVLVGLATGFIPTNTLAATRMLEVLLGRPEAMAAAVQAAQTGDQLAMRRIVYEAGRLSPALAPGQWRYCPQDTTITVAGRARKIAAGTTLMVSTMSAMRDPRAVKDPGKFDPDRTSPDGEWQEPDLLFGVGPHVCMGKHLALAQISALFTELLQRPALRRTPGKAGRMQSVGPFPRSLTLEFDTPAAQQSMVMVVVPLGAAADRPGLDAALAAQGNPAGATIRAALDSTGLVHFCSLAVINAGESQHLAFELSFDGPSAAAFAAIEAQAGALLRPIFVAAGLSESEPLAAFFARHVVTLHGKPWGATGLNFNGLGEFPIAQVERQARLADFTGRAVQDYLASETARGSHPMLTLAHVRRLLAQDPALRRRATPAQHALMDEARREGFDALRLLPSGKQIALAQFKPQSSGRALAKFLASRDRRMLTVPLLVLFAGIAALLWWTRAPSPLPLGAQLVWLGVKAALSAVAGFAALIALFLILLRRAERNDVPDDTHASLHRLREIARGEDSPGHLQNHVMAVGTLKPGRLRRLIHAFSLWGIRVLIESAFRPGFVLNMGTIHYARWWHLPGTEKVVFYSNFDGSWESYLEDFITRARQGQSAAWSNWQGFPPTRFLTLDGAQNGDRFKRWVRTVQQIAPFWYDRFPRLSSDNIRSNALIHAGVARGRTLVEAQSWLECMGSMPRAENRLESGEVQTLVFGALGGLPCARGLVITLPRGVAAGEWLDWLRGRPMTIDGLAADGDADALAALLEARLIVPVPRPAGARAEYALDPSLTVAFGERPALGDKAAPGSRSGLERAVCLSFSAAGLGTFTAPNGNAGTLLDGFPPAFRMGMAARGRVLGDLGASAAESWRWHDNPMSRDPAEALLLLYAQSDEDLALIAQVHQRLLENHGGRVLGAIACAAVDPADPELEHFGFRDGISQPVIRGTSRTTRGVPARDLVEAGEFVLGYRNGQGYFPLSPKVPPESDLHGALPVTDELPIGRYPDFGARDLAASPRDFGRNGSYLVVRELAQDVEGFEAFTQTKADELARGSYADLYKIVGQVPDQEWVKAKLIGRWPSGRPLVGNPVNLQSGPDSWAAEHENDFSFGEDDPQGRACPFGAHIRRANPRDSKQPGDPAEQAITNRHRLLRRGRSYTVAETGERGLMFAALCTDIERQFEFVQQFWINSGAFHGLAHEPDPLVGAETPDPASGCPMPRHFTIPTAEGPVQLTGMAQFVEPRAGGYFFMPGRSALTWLADISLNRLAERKTTAP